MCTAQARGFAKGQNLSRTQRRGCCYPASVAAKSFFVTRELHRKINTFSRVAPLAATRRRLQAAPCADIDGNGTVDVSDLLGLLASYGTDAGGDTNGDGNTDGARARPGILCGYGRDTVGYANATERAQ